VRAWMKNGLVFNNNNNNDVHVLLILFYILLLKLVIVLLHTSRFVRICVAVSLSLSLMRAPPSPLVSHFLPFHLGENHAKIILLNSHMPIKNPNK
jgi:hypothetical protein